MRVTIPPRVSGEKRGDVVYTPDWCAEDIVRHFSPRGRILEPARGGGAFSRFLPPHEWDEITEGRDFFSRGGEFDWVVSNPPYSMTREWFRHTYTLALNFVYLVPLRNVFSGYGFVKEIHQYGGIVELRNYGTGGLLGFPMGNAVGAFHCRRGYKGETRFSFYEKL